MDVTAVAFRAHTLTGASCCAFRRVHFASGQSFSNAPRAALGPRSRIQKKHPKGCFFCMAVGQGFEPREPLGSTVFKTAAFDHSASPPKLS